MTPEPSPKESSRFGLNVTLYVVVVLCALLAVLGAWSIWLNSDDSTGSDRATQAGDTIGDAQIQALPAADTEEQERTAAVLESATKMANAFLNISYENLESTTEAVLALATGDFKKQYESSIEGLTKLTTRAKSVQKGEVTWAGVVASDPDSATVIIASTGTVANTTTKGKAVPRNYRLQLDLAEVDGSWLTQDLQFVTLD